MKLLFLLVVVAIIGVVLYVFFSAYFARSKKKKTFNWKPVGISGGIVLILLVLIAFGMYRSATQPDIWCGMPHVTTTHPTTLLSAMDYFLQGDYDYELGNCQKAVVDYTKSISLNPNYPQAYNNRAYTYMRMRNYPAALADLDKAIALNPNYIQALMNRGDIHNYYYQIDRSRAVIDYEKVIALGGTQKETSVCGHLMLAKHNGWTLGAYVDYFKGFWQSCR